jgi:hypothetical protein
VRGLFIRFEQLGFGGYISITVNFIIVFVIFMILCNVVLALVIMIPC